MLFNLFSHFLNDKGSFLRELLQDWELNGKTKYQTELQEYSKHFIHYNLNMEQCAVVKCTVQ